LIGKLEPNHMLVDGLYQKNIGYFVGEFEDASEQLERHEMGTVFFVSESLYPLAGFVEYAVTCRHVLEKANSYSGFRDSYIRVNGRDGKYLDIPSNLGDWVVSAETDVAVFRFNCPPDVKIFSHPASKHMHEILPGHELFLIGMFSLMPDYESVQVLVRSGHVARPFVENVPITLNPDKPEDVTLVTAHLIESLAWSGQSGSPVYIHDQYQLALPPLIDDLGHPVVDRSLHRSKIVATEVRPPLLGLLHGSLNLPQSEHGGVEMNSGIAIVIPAEQIHSLIRADMERQANPTTPLDPQRPTGGPLSPKPSPG